MEEKRGSRAKAADEVRGLLKKYGIRPNKALGQNFLCDPLAAGCVIDNLLSEGKRVLEIGPGLGAITREICAGADRVLAVEIDSRMADVLETELSEFRNLTVVCSDFLKTDIGLIRKILGDGFIVAGNLPYYITTPIVTKLLTMAPAAERMVLMVQSEAADRFFAGPKDRVYGPLTVLSQTAYDAELVMHVPPTSFFPVPDVSSAIIRFDRKPEKGTDMASFSAILKAAFSMRRKTLANSLFANNMASKEETAAALKFMGYPEDARAESLTPADLLEFSVRMGMLKV
jgi:16S rRNA (adenine1518-N6/adenine1519-N6)-dimethyltransferase